MQQHDIVCIAVGRKNRPLGVFGIQITETGAAHIHSENFECIETLEPEDTLKKLQATWELIQNEPDAPPEDQMRVSDVILSDGTVYHPPFSRLEEIWTKEIIKQWMAVHPPDPCGPDSWVRSLQNNSAVGFMGMPMMIDVPTAEGKTVHLPVTTPWSEIEKIASPAFLEQRAQERAKLQEQEAAEREARKNQPPLPYVCADGTWCCVCGKTGITAKYCINCGSEKPEFTEDNA